MRGKDARWYTVPAASHTRPEALPLARRIEPRRAALLETETSRMATGQRTQSQSEDGCGLFCGRLPNNRESTMNKRINPSTRVGDQGCLPPVRVKLLRRDAYAEQTAPPDGEGEDWGSRLNKALGTVSTDFVRASLLQVQGAARSPFGTISETAINAALAMIEAVAPKDELEGGSLFRWPALTQQQCQYL